MIATFHEVKKNAWQPVPRIRLGPLSRLIFGMDLQELTQCHDGLPLLYSVASADIVPLLASYIFVLEAAFSDFSDKRGWVS